jgi:hypothetical protein
MTSKKQAMYASKQKKNTRIHGGKQWRMIKRDGSGVHAMTSDFIICVKMMRHNYMLSDMVSSADGLCVSGSTPSTRAHGGSRNDGPSPRVVVLGRTAQVGGYMRECSWSVYASTRSGEIPCPCMQTSGAQYVQHR